MAYCCPKSTIYKQTSRYREKDFKLPKAGPLTRERDKKTTTSKGTGYFQPENTQMATINITNKSDYTNVNGITQKHKYIHFKLRRRV